MGRTESRGPNAQALCPDGGCANNAARGADQSRDLGGSSASGNTRSDAGFVLKVESKLTNWIGGKQEGWLHGGWPEQLRGIQFPFTEKGKSRHGGVWDGDRG